MTTYARKIAEAVRDAAIRVTHRPLEHWETSSGRIGVLDLDAIIAGVPEPQAAEPKGLTDERHTDDVAVDLFAQEMKAKMAASRAKGRGGWEGCEPTMLSAMLRDHVEKGDPRDVANFCMMLWHHSARIAQQPSQPAASEAARDAKDAALQAINDIRNSIIGLQTLNWSEHVYPLVVALDKAGYKGMSYPKARKFYGTMLDRCNRAEADTKRLDFLCDHVVNVRDPLPHGSHDMFWASPTDDDSGHAPSNLRALIDSEIERLDRAKGE